MGFVRTLPLAEELTAAAAERRCSGTIGGEPSTPSAEPDYSTLKARASSTVGCMPKASRSWATATCTNVKSRRNEQAGVLQPHQTFIAGRQEPGSKRTKRRLRRYRTGAEGRISHLKRRYGLDRSPLARRPGPADLA
jgi:hypothetical protein